MKHLLLAILLFPLFGFGQSLTPEVVSTSGDHFTASPGELSWSLGEISIETYNGTSNQLTQGFHQPENGIVSINELNNLIEINAYPNPFKTVLTIDSESDNFALVIYDALGNEILREIMQTQGSKTLDLSSLSSGIYFLKFSDNTGILQTIKVQKQ